MKTHNDYINEIGETNATGKTYLEKRWNKYYIFVYHKIVSSMLKYESRDTVFDVGTSHGNWINFLREAGFKRILGVELDASRAEEARGAGYDLIYNCDAAHTPLENNSIDIAISNDVFVHILQINDKAAVLREIYRVLKPGGLFIVNHTMAPAFGRSQYFIDKYCSFLSPAEWIECASNAGFKIEDVKPSYYLFRTSGLLIKALRSMVVAIPLGLGSRALALIDSCSTRWLNIGESDYVYLKLRKQCIK